MQNKNSEKPAERTSHKPKDIVPNNQLSRSNPDKHQIHQHQHQHQHYKKNREIKALEVRVIHNGQNKVIPTKDAIAIAIGHELDLIEVSPNAIPPVCKILCYTKFLYEIEKAKKADKPPKAKEIQFHVNIAEHDFQTKIKQAHHFLESHHPLTVKVQFRGREAAHKELGVEVLNKFTEKLVSVAKHDGSPKINGKIAIVKLTPTKQKVHPHADNHKNIETNNII